MKLTVLGGTGRTGRLLVRDLLDDGHDLTLLVRDPAKVVAGADRVTIVPGHIRDRRAVDEAVAGAEAIVSALGPVGRDTTLLRDTARILTASSDTDWTLVRVPRLVDGDAGAVEVDPHRSGRRTTLTRANLARFLADTVTNGSYPRQAPFVTDL